MNIEAVNDKLRWNEWAIRNDVSFLQSWEWGEILISEGKNVERLAIMENGATLAQAQIARANMLFNKYAFCPNGPAAELTINNEQLTNIWRAMFNYVKENDILFFRIEPTELLVANCALLIKKSFDITPRATTVLDLIKSEEDLLAGMREKTRYNIKLASKKDTKIEKLKDFNNFWELMQQTGVRNRFRLHEEKHYEAILKSPMSRQLSVKLLTSNSKLKTVATAIFIGFGDTFTYLFGASDYHYRNLMSPYLIQWEGIKLAKNLGYKKYDFFGIAPRCHSEPAATSRRRRGGRSEESKRLANLDSSSAFGRTQDDKYEYDPKHQYAGVTRFKLGFGGYVQEKPGTYDLVVSPSKYKIYNALRKLRRLI